MRRGQFALAGPEGPLRQPGVRSPATPRDCSELAPRFLKLAAQQGQSLCLSVWTARLYPGDDTRLAAVNLAGARKGCATCQAGLYFAYRDGKGVPRDMARALCWAGEAGRLAGSPDYAAWSWLTAAPRQPVDPEGRPGDACAAGTADAADAAQAPAWRTGAATP